MHAPRTSETAISHSPSCVQPRIALLYRGRDGTNSLNCISSNVLYVCVLIVHLDASIDGMIVCSTEREGGLVIHGMYNGQEAGPNATG